MRKNDDMPAFTVDAGFLQKGLTKKEYVLVSVAQGLLAGSNWSGTESGFPGKVEEITETILDLMDEKS